MSLADFFALVGVVILTLSVVLGGYVGWGVYKREQKFAPPKRRRRHKSSAAGESSPTDLFPTRLL